MVLGHLGMHKQKKEGHLGMHKAKICSLQILFLIVLWNYKWKGNKNFFIENDIRQQLHDFRIENMHL